MENNRINLFDDKVHPFLFEIWLYGTIASLLIAISNLVFFLILKTNQMLFVTASSIGIGTLYILARYLLQRNHVFISTLTSVLAWVLTALIHKLYWSGVDIFITFALWLLPIFIIVGIPSIKEKLFFSIPPLLASGMLFLLEKYQVFPRLYIPSFELSRLIAPVYFFILGILIFLILLRSVRTRSLALKIILSMALIVFIPIVILTMVSYSNTKLSDTLAAANNLDQIAERKNVEVLQWIDSLAPPLVSLLSENDTYQMISRLLDADEINDSRSVLAYRDSLEYILSNISARYDFNEIYILNSLGIVVTSTREDYFGVDFSEYEFFKSGMEEKIILSPSYFPLEDQTSIFISIPILGPTNRLQGVLSARTTTDRLIEIITQPSTETYQTTSSYILNPDGTLLELSIGRPTLVVNTTGAQTLIANKEKGYLNYQNIDGIPVVGVFRWLPELNIGVLVEANEEEVYQGLPRIITGNLSIGLLGFLLAIGAAISIVRSITKPINDMVNASKEVIAGNFNVQLPVDREDELGILTNAFNRMTDELKVLVSDLEIRVADRTRDLESRSQDLEASAIIARDASLASDMQDLLDRTAQLIQERFGFYHVGIFLNDTKGEYSVLSSAAGDAGQKLLAIHHKLKIGETGIVGTVTKIGEPRIALDVGVDAVYFKNPLLPNTRSEMTLPLIVRQQIIGALDVQSEKVSAFDQNDIRIMGVLADQLAIAIERTRLVEETIKNAAQLRMALQSQTSVSWNNFISQTDQPIGYRYQGVTVTPISRPDEKDQVDLTAESISSQSETEKQGTSTTVPIRLRGLTIGNLDLNFSTSSVPTETLQFLEGAADRVALALENARLFKEVTLRAEREKTVTNITTNIRSKTDPSSMVQTALDELKRVLGASEIKVHNITPPDTSIEASEKKNTEDNNINE